LGGGDEDGERADAAKQEADADVAVSVEDHSDGCATGDQRSGGHCDSDACGAGGVEAAAGAGGADACAFERAFRPRVLGGEYDQAEEDDEDPRPGKHDHDQPGTAEREPCADDEQSLRGGRDPPPAVHGGGPGHG